MDTISRENNSILPVVGVAAGVVGVLLGAIALVKLSSVTKTLEAHSTKIEKIDGLESQVATVSATSEKATKDIKGLSDSTQAAFNQVGGLIGEVRASITKLEEAAKKPVVVPGKKGGGEPAVAGPNEHIVKKGEYGTTIAKARGVSLADLKAVNPGVDFSKMHVGQKLKVPVKK